MSKHEYSLQIEHTYKHVQQRAYIHASAVQSNNSCLTLIPAWIVEHFLWASSSDWYELPPFHPGGQQAGMKRVRRAEDARGRSQKNLTLKAAPCLQYTASQWGLCDPVTGHCRGQHTASCAHCHSCQSARFDSWQMMFVTYHHVNHTLIKALYLNLHSSKLTMQLLWVVIFRVLRSFLAREDFLAVIVFVNKPIPPFCPLLARPVWWGVLWLETETDRCSGVWCLTCSHSMRSSQRGDLFDSKGSLTMITLSLGVLLKVRGEPQPASKSQTIVRQWNQKTGLKSSKRY